MKWLPYTAGCTHPGAIPSSLSFYLDPYKRWSHSFPSLFSIIIQLEKEKWSEYDPAAGKYGRLSSPTTVVLLSAGAGPIVLS